MSKICSIKGRRVWDSRGQPTVEVEVGLETGIVGRAIAPAGASRGRREATDMRDGTNSLRGKGVDKAVQNVNGPIAGILSGLDVQDQKGVDEAMLAWDSTPLKSRLGGNATVAASLAVLHAAAADAGVPLWRHIADTSGTNPLIPLPEIQIFGGGAHADRTIDLQDYMIMVPGAIDLEEVMEVTSEVYFAAGDVLKNRGILSGVADEGGWWPSFRSNEEGLEILVSAIEKAGENPGDRVVISLDIAASEFGSEHRYHLAAEGRLTNTEGLVDMLGRWLDAYPIASVEDPVGEDDFEGMVEFTRRYGDRVQIVGDDFLVTNPQLVRESAEGGACNAVLLKVNQAGTVTESLEAFSAARSIGWGTIVSARSGESEDVTISHLSTGLGSGQLKVGSFQRSERMAKWNECLRIQEILGVDAFAAGLPLARTWWGKERSSDGN